MIRFFNDEWVYNLLNLSNKSVERNPTKKMDNSREQLLCHDRKGYSMCLNQTFILPSPRLAQA